tara:strand:- start:2655 stop:3056 length:402 start_codon:yes stop_codon:yes gene_type:complete
VEQKSYLDRWKLSLVLLPILLLSSGCSSWRDVLPIQVKTVEVERKIPTQNRPRPVKMNDVHFYVVTEDTFDEFKERFIKENGDFLFYALSVRDYETIALNMSELKRFIDQQKQIIIYYEKAVAPVKKDKKEIK